MGENAVTITMVAGLDARAGCAQGAGRARGRQAIAAAPMESDRFISSPRADGARTMMVIGAVGALTVNSLDLLGKRAAVRGWYSGTSADSEDTLLFSQLNQIASMNEIFPLEEAQAAYDRMMSGKARFRVVLKIDS